MYNVCAILIEFDQRLRVPGNEPDRFPCVTKALDYCIYEELEKLIQELVLMYIKL